MLETRSILTLCSLKDWENLRQCPTRVNPAGKWMKFVVADKTSLHATLSWVAVHYMVTTGDMRAKVQHFHHTTATIQAINEAINDPEQRYSDGVIGAVCNLAAQAVSHLPFNQPAIYSILIWAKVYSMQERDWQYSLDGT